MSDIVASRARSRCAGCPSDATRTGWAARLLALATAVLLAACAAPAQRANMEVGAPPVQARANDHTVAVRVSGGDQPDNADFAGIPNDEFKAAIEASLKRAGAFGNVLSSPAGAGYVLNASIVGVRRPAMGFSFTVDMEVAWTLTRQRDGAALLRKAITSTHTATTSEAFAAVTRLRLAVEGAARKNIESLLKQLAAVEL